MPFSRYITHGVVVVTALLLSSYASIDRHLPATLSMRLGAVNASGVAGAQGGSVGSVEMGRSGTIIKPLAIPTGTVRSHDPLTVTVGDGDDLAALAKRYGVSVDGIRWSNFDALKSTSKDVAKGDTVVVPPVDGVVVRVAEGDTAATIASRYGVDQQVIVDFNYLRDPERLEAGSRLVVPGGHGPDFEKPVVITPAYAAPRAPSTTAYSVASGGPAAGSAAGNRFDYGYCTWYVASRRPVPWLGDAWQWFGNAQAAGWATGQTPKAGAIMVTWESGWGHVAIVEKVNADGSWVVSEMNFVGWGVVSTRTIKPGSVPLEGFIY